MTEYICFHNQEVSNLNKCIMKIWLLKKKKLWSTEILLVSFMHDGQICITLIYLVYGRAV